ncbi:MAG: hypothetical protein JSS65_00370 [Armatimonadetes bacterium]|nr:hypothetical protein [Armatimonadota bacterium]
MSIRINTNIPAMTALRHLGQTDDMFGGVVTRLSTGLRINTAADDPAGLINSEGLRSYINGIDAAVQNSQDAANMSKTAEAALSEVSQLLLEVKSIAVQSANTAVVDANQLQANQTSIRSILASIDRIANQTSWGSKLLLNGASGAVSNVTRTDLVNSLNIGSSFNGEIVKTGNITIQRTTAATQTTTGAMATTFATSATSVNTGTFAINGTTFTVPSGATVSSVLAMINQASDQTGVTASYAAGSGITLTSVKYGANFPIRYTETSTILNGGAVSVPAVGANAVFTVTAPTVTSGTQTETFTGGQGPGVDGLTLTSPTGNRMVISAAGNATSASTLIGALSVGSLQFQIGATADQTASFSLPNMASSNLGTTSVPGSTLATIDVTSSTGANNAMKIVDEAVQQVATFRGQLGSFTKDFLQSNIRSLGIAKENLTASESSIRDADVAYEMTQMTKLQILKQSGMAVLAQANQSPQSVLNLLRGG